MTPEQIAEWVFRVALAVFVFLWGRSTKQTEELAQAQAQAVALSREQQNSRIAELERVVASIPTLTEERLELELRDLAHKARDLILTDLNAVVARIERKVDEGSTKSSETWSRVQCRVNDLEIRMTRLATIQEERRRR